MLASILAAEVPAALSLRWLVVFDGGVLPQPPEPVVALLDRHGFVRHETYSSSGAWGNPQRSRGIDLAESGFLYFLDDDNLLHERLMAALAEELRLTTTMRGLMFHQRSEQNGRSLTAGPENVRVCHVDTAQFVVHTGLVGSTRWHAFDRCADGHFIEALYRAEPEGFVFRDQVLCYYNELP